MKFDQVTIKLTLLIVAQQLIAIFKTNITRWLIKTFFTTGELPLAKWYTIEFIQALNLSRILSLGVIASFTLITFPLGLWVSSFNIGKSYPISRIIGTTTFMITFPVNLYLMAYKLRELPINPQTILGAIIIELAYAAATIGAYMMHIGANGGPP